MQIILLIFPILLLSALFYFLLLTVNNIIWGYKGISIDKQSPEYRKRKRLLKIISIPLSILILILIGLPSINGQEGKKIVSIGSPIYLSPFGFSVNIPSHWKITNSRLLMENPGREKALNTLFEALKIAEEKKKEIMQALKNGQMEYWHYRDSPNNATCRKVKGRGILNSSDFSEFVKRFKKLGNEVEVHDLGLKKIAGLDAFYYEWGGLVHGLRILQIHIQITPKEYFQFTLTTQVDRFEILKGEFWEIISTFKPL